MLQNIDFKDKKTQIAILAVIASIAIFYGWYSYIYVDKVTEAERLQKALKKKQHELNEINTNRTQLSLLREEVFELDNVLDSLKLMFPDEREVSTLVKDIHVELYKSGINSKKFVPLPPIPKEFYVENQYKMSVVGGYHELAEFFAYLANLDLIINLSEISIVMNPEIRSSINNFKENSSKIESVVANFKLTTFSSKK